jgi:hypothetical protein
MKKRILLSIAGTVLTVGILIAIDANKSVNFLSSNGFVLENALALAHECGEGYSVGSPISQSCNVPLYGSKAKCPYTIITCQGSQGCCSASYCLTHK